VGTKNYTGSGRMSLLQSRRLCYPLFVLLVVGDTRRAREGEGSQVSVEGVGVCV
jgi:hypothetical protein